MAIRAADLTLEKPSQAPLVCERKKEPGRGY